ncbi:MAG TPA: secondary thiamine-phosphate synthase enzyme YjbQ, partial [bacterium]
MLKEIFINTRSRIELINVDKEVTSAVSECGIQNGLCHLWVPHTTAAITINENADPSVVRDILTSTSKLIPQHDRYLHAEGNSDAHIKSSLFGPSLTLIVAGGKLCLGTWQSVYFCEFDGPRRRILWIKT